jgi:hypothetical protein
MQRSALLSCQRSRSSRATFQSFAIVAPAPARLSRPLF